MSASSSLRLSQFLILAAGFAGIVLSLGPAPAVAEQSYTVRFEGAPAGLEDKLKLISALEKGVRDYPTAAALRRAALRDIKVLDNALQAAGYYNGRTSFELEPGVSNQKPVVVFTIEPGAPFRIVEYEILYSDDGDGRPLSFKEAGITPDHSAAGADLRDAQRQFLNFLWESGYPAAEAANRRAIANLDENTAHAVFIFTSGPKARFGDIRAEGLEKTDPKFLGKLKTWKLGDQYERSKIVSYRDRVAATGLFSTIEVAAGAPDDAGVAPIILNVEERARRTLGAGASFSTAEGPGGRLFFEHRNIFGKGENFRVDARGSSIEQSLDFSLNKPLPSLPGHAFSNFKFSNQTTEAFNARSIRVSGGIAKRWFGRKLETRGSVALETSNIVADGSEERTYLISVPLSVLWNSENDLLGPTSGVRTGIVVTPYAGSQTFTQAKWTARSRVTFGKGDRFTLAGRGALGATFASAFDGLPLNKRFFAGGGGSVRGYGFQEAGPLDGENAPIGGRSLIEGAVELRGKVSSNIQLAGFVDTGSVSSSNLPDFNEKFFIGYGGGVRYLSAIGPVRLDVAFPLDKRESDSGYQLYIALGQPF